jgi:protein transport protein SEC13
MNSISWAPHEYGLILAAAASDGKIIILEYRSDAWVQSGFVNDNLGCNAVSWAPYTALGSQLPQGGHVLRLVTGSCDNTVRIWKYDGQWEQSAGKWIEESRPANCHSGEHNIII